MSWIFGYISDSVTQSDVERIARIIKKPDYTIKTDWLYLAAGGPDSTCKTGRFDPAASDRSTGWVVVGLGLQDNHTGQIAPLSENQWTDILSVEKPDLTGIDGHFAVLTWKKRKLTCATDQLGLRSLFFAHSDSGYAVSTRLDWIARWCGKSDVNFRHFGSHWLTFNQLGYGCLVDGIERLGPGARAIFTPRSVETSVSHWLPRKPDTTDLVNTLSRLLDPSFADRTLSLGLSGGLDSRFLLSLLTASKKSFSIHVFGNSEDPDVRISKNIGMREEFDHQHIKSAHPDPRTLPAALLDYCGQLCATGPASTILKSYGYTFLNDQGKLMIDGGFGEIARRQFFNRLLRQGPRNLLDTDPASLLQYFYVNQSELFNRETLDEMKRGVQEDLQLLSETMPPIQEFGRENFADLLAVRTRLPSFYGYEQARLDGVVPNFMPFAQPSFLNTAFHTPIETKQDGYLFRKTIRSTCPALARYPLVKGGTTYPFRLSSLSAGIWTKIKSSFGYRFIDPTPITFLHALSEYVQDLLHSSDTVSYPAYDYKSVKNTVERFYAGDHTLASRVDWWLAFEIWRRSLRSELLSVNSEQ